MRELWKDTMKSLQKIFEDIGADAKVIDASRILRLPHSINRKAKYGPEGKRVSVVYENDASYELNDLNQKLRFMADGGTEGLLEDVLEKMDNITFAGAVDEETMFIPVDVSEEDDVFKDVVYVEPIKRKTFEPEKEDFVEAPEEMKVSQKKKITVTQNKKEKDTQYQGICVDYDSLPDIYFQNKDMLYWIYNRRRHEGYRNTILFFFQYNWYSHCGVKTFETFYRKTKKINSLFHPPLGEDELRTKAKSVFEFLREKPLYFCIRNSVIQERLHFTEEEMKHTKGNYYEKEEEHKEKRKLQHRKTSAELYRKNLKQQGKQTKEEKNEAVKKMLLENPDIRYKEFEQLTGKSPQTFWRYKKEIGLVGYRREKRKEEYFEFFEKEEDTSKEAFMEKFQCSLSTYRNYKREYLHNKK